MTMSSYDGQVSIDNLSDLNQQLGRWSELNEEKQDLIRRAQSRIDEAKAELQSALEPLDKQQRDIEAAATVHLKRRRRSLRNRFGITIQLDNGIVKWRIIGRSLDTPKDTQPIVKHLLGRRGGRRYLRVKYELDRKALAGADHRLLRDLASLGVWAGRHEQLTILPRGAEDPILLEYSRYPRRNR